MKNNFTKKFGVLVLVLSVWMAKPVNGQDFSDFFQGGMDDAQLLLTEYIRPLGESMGVNLNSGWINAGHPFKTARFELKFVVPITMISADRMSFDPSALGLSGNWEFHNSENLPATSGSTVSEVPTAFGEGTAYAHKVFGTGTERESVAIPLIGANIPFNFLLPAAQLSIGIVKKTELMIRWIPTFEFDGVSAGSFGLGVKHDIGQWIPVVSRLPFTLSASAAFNSMNAVYNLDYVAESPDGDRGATFDDQELGIRANGWHLGVYASKKIPFLTAYGGFRLMSSNMRIGAFGTYQYYEPQATQTGIDYNLRTETDPLEFNMPFTQLGVTAGLRLKLGILALGGEVNYGRFTTYSLSLGLGFID